MCFCNVTELYKMSFFTISQMEKVVLNILKYLL